MQVPLGILESVELEVVDMGEAPIRLGGIKVYESCEDNLMTEGALIFGSGMRLRAGIKLRLPGTGFAVYLPVEIYDIQARPRPFAAYVQWNCFLLQSEIDLRAEGNLPSTP